MHIPDGFLNLTLIIAADGVILAILAQVMGRINRTLTPARIPLLGLSAAFVFTVQLLSFPVPGGISVHLSAAVLITVLLGPFSGLVVVSASMILQALLFQHGGILSLGVNIFNTGVVGCLGGYFIIKLWGKKRISGAGVAAFISIVVGAFFSALAVGYSGIIPLQTGIPAMVGSHIFAGLAEAFITVSVLVIIKKTRPDLLELEKV